MACSRGCCPSQADHYRSITVAASATPTRKGAVAAIDAKEARWQKDMPAYRRLRKDGLQPKSIDGSDRLEKHAESKAEVETGQVLNDRQRAQVKELTGDHI